MLDFMTRSLPFTLAIIGLFLLLIVVFLVLVLRRAGSRSAQSSAGDGADPTPGQRKASRVALKAGFYRALFRLRRTFAVRDFRYKVPWVLGLGTRPQADGLLANSGVSLPFGPPPPGDASGSRWWFCDGGVFLEVPGASSASPDGGAIWSKVLGELVDHRPERPVDSLVLTVSSRELRSARRDPTGRQELEKAAEVLYERVWQAQQRLGLRLPIYLVVTDCESLPGFVQLSGRLREGLRRQIFGWSNPYSLDTTYRSDWIGEAFDNLGERLRRVLIETFTERPPRLGADEIFLFPREIRALEDPLRRFTDRVFKPSAYHEPMLLRGIFFTGDEEAPLRPEEQGEVSDLPLAEEESLLDAGSRSFLLELIEQKIFPEGALAQPTAGRLQARSRSVRIAQAVLASTALILGIGVWHAYSKLAESNRVLVPFLEKLSRDLAQVYTVRRQGLGSDHDTATRRVSHFAEGLSRIDISQYRSGFLPSSWFDPVDGELRQTMRIGFEQIIAEALRLNLEQSATRLLEETVVGGRGPGEIEIFPVHRRTSRERAHAIPIEQTAAYVDLRRFVAELAELDQNQKLFNSLKAQDGGELERLALLVSSLFRYELPQVFFENSGLYASALSGSGYEGFDPRKFRPEVELRLRGLSRSLDRTLYEDSTLVTVLEDLVERLDDLRSGAWLRGDGREAIQEIVGRLGEADDLVASAAVSWAFRRRFDLGAPYEETMALAASTDFLELPSEGVRREAGRDVLRELRQESEAGWLGLRRRLAEARSDVTGPLLALDSEENILPALSADVQVLHAALLQYRSERFLADRGRGDDSLSRQLAVTLPGGAVRRWDTIYLDQAIKLYEAYLSFREGSLQEFPEGVREPLGLVARSGLYNQMTDFIRQAQIFVSKPVTSDPRLLEENLHEEVELFQAAAPALNRLLAVFEDLQLRQAKLELEKVFLRQGSQFLRQIDGLLRARQLYQAQYEDFSWWDGEGNLAFQSFGVSDEADLVSYLDLQREQVRYLGRSLAQPVVNSLGTELVAKSPETQTLHLGWQEILVALADYDDKKPGNSVASLENLIQIAMAKATPVECAAASVAVPRTGVRTNFFASRELSLRRGLYRRCLELTSERALSYYVEVAGFFNQHLSGRYPFADPDSEEGAVEADAEMVRRFFELFDPVAEEILTIPSSHPRFAGRGPEALAFVEQMRRVQAFFRPFVGGLEALDGPGEAPASAGEDIEETLAEVPTYDLRLEFRVHREREVGANQIIRWTLGIEETEISHRDAEPLGRWILGQPVRLSLEWASDGPLVPLPPEDLPGVWVEERTAVFERQGAWALLAFLKDFESPRKDFEDFEDPRPHTLKFLASTVPAAPAEDEEGIALEVAPEPVVVYVRLVVLAPGKSEPLRLPELPVAAPVLPDSERMEARVTRGGFARGS